MKCPSCERDLEEGKLYCENCGYEIQIVPDFEPEIETSITETLSNIAEKLEEKDAMEDISFEQALEKPDYMIRFLHKVQNRFLKIKTEKKELRILLLVGSMIFLCISAFALVKAYQYNSYEYQYKKAVSFGNKKDYVEAVSYLERAMEIDEESPEATLLLAEYYLKQQKEEDAIFVLEGTILSNQGTEEIYSKLISIYEGRKEFEKISKILAKCEDKEILEAFSAYAALPPEFSVSEGDYEEVVHLKLIGNTTGEIYYTLDGSEPTEKSPLYTTPLFLEAGEYVVSAIFVNKYAVKSEVSSKTYYIDVEQPNPPEISLYSGLYQVPEMIEAISQPKEKIFYTTDGKTPTMDSTPYNGPIPMPFGATSFKFVAFSEDGVSSEVVERAYRLQIPANISAQDAVNLTTQRMVELGVLSDAAGNLPNLEGKNLYICSSAIAFGNETYYLVLEFYQDAAGTIFKTEKEYAVHIMTGELCQALKEKSGYYQVAGM